MFKIKKKNKRKNETLDHSIEMITPKIFCDWRTVGLWGTKMLLLFEVSKYHE